MAVFRSVGYHLKEKFDGAAKVIGSNDGTYLMPEGETIKPPVSEDVIYTENSPNFCRPNRKYGSLGTKGRMCDPKSMGVGGCDLLCCGRGYRKEQITLQENCKCRFRWCCEVICQTCTSQKTIHSCL